MKISKKNVAVQLYTVRDFIKTSQDFTETMKKIRAIGYEAVQLSKTTLPAKEMKAIMDGEGITPCATHEPGKDFFENLPRIIDDLHTLNCAYTAYPYPHKLGKTALEWQEFGQELDGIGAALRKEGITLTYHNHAMEFEKFDGKTALDILYDSSCAINLQSELDTHWVQMGGANPILWLKKMANRMPLLHLKDSGVLDFAHTMREIGNGNLPWKEILEEADKGDCLWYIVEQDACPGDPFDSLKISFDYLSRYF